MSWESIDITTPTGNTSVFIAADPIVTAGSGNNVNEVDFNNTFCVQNPWKFSTTATIILTVTNRNDPV